MVEDPDSQTVLVNKYHQLSPDYKPDLVRMGTAYTYGTAYLQREAWEQFKAMADQARTEGIRLWNVSSYRSYGTQERVYDRYVSQDGQSLADTYSAVQAPRSIRPDWHWTSIPPASRPTLRTRPPTPGW